MCIYPLSSGMTLPTALAAPVEAGIMFWWAPRPSRQALALGPSTVFWVAVYAWTVVYRGECHITYTAHFFGVLIQTLNSVKSMKRSHLSRGHACLQSSNRFTETYHESLLDSKVIMDDFGQRSQAVGGAGGITINRMIRIVSNYNHLTCTNLKITFSHPEFCY